MSKHFNTGTTKKVTAIIELEDNGQDLQSLTVSYYPDFKFGIVIDCDLQKDIWVDMCVLGKRKPAIGDNLILSKSPDSEVIKLKHKISAIDFR